MGSQRWMLVAMLVAAGCAAPVAPFPVLGDRSRLTGKWEGTYEGAGTGRTGTILFQFGAGTDSAYGSVMMDPGAARALRVTYVWCGGDEVTGRLDPYEDPITGELVYTMFEGRLAGDVLSGSFSTLYADRGRLLEGTWSVRRRIR